MDWNKLYSTRTVFYFSIIKPSYNIFSTLRSKLGCSFERRLVPVVQLVPLQPGLLPAPLQDLQRRLRLWMWFRERLGNQELHFWRSLRHRCVMSKALALILEREIVPSKKVPLTLPRSLFRTQFFTFIVGLFCFFPPLFPGQSICLPYINTR